MRDIGHHEPPREFSAQAYVEVERQPSVRVDGGAISRTQVIVGTFHTSRDEPAGVYTEVRTRVDQKLPFADFVRYEETACHRSADMCSR